MPPRRRRLPPKRKTPRRRVAPEWTATEWAAWSPVLLARARYACERCSVPVREATAHRHHRVRRRDGGDRAANLLILCAVCHDRVHHNPEQSRQAGWIVASTEDPALVPVRIRGMLWMLDDDGGSRPVP